MAKSFLLNNGKVPLAYLVHCLAFTTNDDLSAADSRLFHSIVKAVTVSSSINETNAPI